MKDIVWTPEPYKVPVTPEDSEWDSEKENQTKQSESPFKGSVVFTMPLYTQRLKYLKECNFNTGKDVDVAGGSSYDSMIRMVEIAKKHIAKVDLTFEEADENGEAKAATITSFDELQESAEGADAINQIATLILRGTKIKKI